MELILVLGVLAFLAVNVNVPAVPSARSACMFGVAALCVVQLVRLWP